MIARVVAEYDPSLFFYGLSGSEMRRAADDAGLCFVSEVFADRTYQPDGSLTPRTKPDALIVDPAQAVEQVLRMVTQGKVLTQSGPVSIAAETICLHGDGSHAVEFAVWIHDALAAAQIRIAFSGSFTLAFLLQFLRIFPVLCSFPLQHTKSGQTRGLYSAASGSSRETIFCARGGTAVRVNINSTYGNDGQNGEWPAGRRLYL